MESYSVIKRYGRSFHKTVLINNSVLIIGGRKGLSTALNSVDDRNERCIIFNSRSIKIKSMDY